MSAPRVVLVHGWSFDARMWDGVAAHLADVDCARVDLGFFGAPLLPALPADRAIVAVGHSLGVAWLLTQAPFAFQALVSVNGFARFLEAPDYAPAVRPAALARLRRQFQRHPRQALADFRSAAGAPQAGGEPDTERLLAGLDGLARWDGRAALARQAARTWVVAGEHDAIVPLAMSRQAFGAVAPQRWRVDPRPGHVLPLTDPALCAAVIRRAASGL